MDIRLTRSLSWGARPPRAQRTAPSRFAGSVQRTAQSGEHERAHVRREGAPNRSRGGCAPRVPNGIGPVERRYFFFFGGGGGAGLFATVSQATWPSLIKRSPRGSVPRRL